MRSLRYQLCDVFTDRPLAGNALAVFTDARAFDDATMQALAREMNLSETAFVLRATSPAADARVRIFTPTMELPFAGHPTLGTAFVLTAALQREVIRLETARGVSTVRMTGGGSRVGFGWMTQPLPQIEPFGPTDALLGALGVAGPGALPIERYDNGVRSVLVELPTPEAVAALRPDLGRLAALGPLAVTAFARAANPGDPWKVRVFAPGEGINEDPATGAVAGPLAVHLARHGRTAWGERIVIAQGAEIGRPSTLHACALGSALQLDAVEVGGSAVLLARAELSLP